MLVSQSVSRQKTIYSCFQGATVRNSLITYQENNRSRYEANQQDKVTEAESGEEYKDLRANCGDAGRSRGDGGRCDAPQIEDGEGGSLDDLVMSAEVTMRRGLGELPVVGFQHRLDRVGEVERRCIPSTGSRGQWRRAMLSLGAMPPPPKSKRQKFHKGRPL